MERLRYGIVGGGFVASFHLRAFCQIRGIEVAGIATGAPPEKLIAFAREHGLGEARHYRSVREMAAHVDVVALFGKHHKRIGVLEEIRDAVGKGAELKGIICEKPFARNMPEARQMLELIEQIGVPHAYFENQCHMSALNAQLRQLAPVIAEMGPLSLVRSAEEHGGAHSDWFWDPRIAGGGVMNDMGCHCLAVGWYALTPPGKSVRHLQPQSVQADLSLLKWGQPRWSAMLQEKYGVDFAEHPAEDFATGVVTYKHPDSGQIAKAQFTSSWMYDNQAMRLYLDGVGAGYGLEMSTHWAPSNVFIGDMAAASVADSEVALEKTQATRGLLSIQPNEPDLYGYTDENRDAYHAFTTGRPPLLDWRYGLEIVRLTMAAYLSAERGQTVDLTDPETVQELETYIPLIQQGRGREVLG